MNDKTEKDAFDTLSEKEPEKYKKLQNSLLEFVNTHLRKLNLQGTLTHHELYTRSHSL